MVDSTRWRDNDGCKGDEGDPKDEVYVAAGAGQGQ
jgi:hypothetical protein